MRCGTRALPSRGGNLLHHGPVRVGQVYPGPSHQPPDSAHPWPDPDQRSRHPLSAEELRTLRANQIGMVFQNMALLPHSTVRDNIAFALGLRNTDPFITRHQLADRLLGTVGLQGYGDSIPCQVSFPVAAAACRTCQRPGRRPGNPAHGRAILRPGSLDSPWSAR